MQKLKTHYKQLSDRYSKEASTLRRKLRARATFRLLFFVLILGATYFFKARLGIAIAIFLLGMALFLFLVRNFEDVKAKFRYTKALIKVNNTELRILNGDFDGMPTGAEHQDGNHAYGHDLDLFGEGSFFQYINRAQLPEGKTQLAQLLTENSIAAIGAKQETIDELALRPEWRQHFAATASLVEGELDLEGTIGWLEGHASFVPRSMRMVPWVFLGIFVLLSTASYALGWPSALPLCWTLLGLGLTSRYYSGIAQLAQKADRVKSVFKQYHKMLSIIEETEFEAPQLRYQKQRLFVAGEKASQVIGRFYRLLNTMDYNNNVFYAIFANGCFLGALHTAYGIESWIEKNRSFVREWFHVIAFFEAQNSLGTFAFNHPSYSYPLIAQGPVVLECQELGHPLIDEKKSVKNDFAINDEEFFILTGSNMAGKSTFLRSVGLCIVMANLGLPVCARECLYGPRKLVTSMRSIDSLYKGDSYFLSELKRLKMVVQLVEKDCYFVLLDEILKGTNSMDKAQGSRKFLARLLRAYATGLIATHDLSLCEAANDEQNVHNYHLDATIEGGNLSFDYLLKKGVSKTMNASFLLKKMDLV